MESGAGITYLKIAASLTCSWKSKVVKAKKQFSEKLLCINAFAGVSSRLAQN